MSRTRLRHEKLIDREVEVYIQNNTNGAFFWESLNKASFVKFDNQGEDEVITFGELRTMVTQLRPYFASMRLIITEVNDPNVSVMDVAEMLHLGKIYETFFDKIMDIDFKELSKEDQLSTYVIADDIQTFVLESDIEDFRAALKTDLKNTLIETSVAIYRNDIGNVSYDKMTEISKIRHDTENTLWNDISASQAG